MTPIRLSIITIAYNDCDGLKKTVPSVLAQTYPHIEYIIVDGASTDDTPAYLRSLQAQTQTAQTQPESAQPTNANPQPNNTTTETPTIAHILSEPDTGIYNAMNKGLALATGDYCLFLNSGDYLAAPDAISQALDDAFPRGTDIVYGHQWDDIDGTLVEEMCVDEPWISFDTMRRTHIPHQSTFLLRSRLVALGGYDERYRIVSDWAMVMTILFLCNGTIARIPRFISVYDTTGVSSNPDKAPQRAERRDFLERHFPRILPDYDRFDRLNATTYMRLIRSLRTLKNRLSQFFSKH